MRLNAPGGFSSVRSFPTSRGRPFSTRSLSARFRAARTLVYLPDEDRFVLAHGGWAPLGSPFRGLLFFDSAGALVETISLAPKRPVALGYVPGLGHFAVRYPAAPAVLDFVDRSGAFVRSLDMSVPSAAWLTGVRALTYFDTGSPSAGRFLVLGARNATRPY